MKLDNEHFTRSRAIFTFHMVKIIIAESVTSVDKVKEITFLLINLFSFLR